MDNGFFQPIRIGFRSLIAADTAWTAEEAMWTLNYLLPKEYQTNTPTTIFHYAINYIKMLKEEIQKLEHKLKMTSSLTDEEEEILLQELGMNSESQGLFKVETEWVTAFTKIPSPVNSAEKPIIVKLPVEDQGEKENIKEEKEEDSMVSDQPALDSNSTKPLKRPGNGFIRFSIEKRKELSLVFPKCNNRDLSKLLGLMWRRLPPEEKQPYLQQFEEEMTKIKIEHPDWNYAGNRSKISMTASLASESSTCLILPYRLRPQRSSLQGIMQNLLDYSPRPKKQKASKPNKAGDKLELWVMCDLCYQWRKLPKEMDSSTLPEKWDCSKNPDPMFNHCNVPEEVHI